MAVKPILFNTEMVRAILEGRKTQTRRLVKPSHRGAAGFNVCFRKSTGEFTGVYDWNDEESMYEDRTPAPCQPGDILWVRETWHGLKTGNEKFGHHKTFWYKADEKDENPDDKWRPSIHMPREAARIFLKVKDVRIERLQDMSEEDAISEGYSGVCPGAHTVYFSDGYAEPCHVGGEDCRYSYWYCNHSIQEAFGSDIWDKTIKPADLPFYGWNANPWVWVIEFKRLDGKPAGLWADRDTAQWADQDVLMPAT